MRYDPLKRKSRTFTDLKVGEKFFFYCDRVGVGAEQCVKVSDDSYIGLGLNGNGMGGLGRVGATQLASAVERLGMMPEDQYKRITASYRLQSL